MLKMFLISTLLLGHRKLLFRAAILMILSKSANSFQFLGGGGSSITSSVMIIPCAWNLRLLWKIWMRHQGKSWERMGSDGLWKVVRE